MINIKPICGAKRNYFMKSTKLLCSLLALAILATSLVGAVNFTAQAETSVDYLQIAQGIINWKKFDVGSTPEGYLINDQLLSVAGTTPGDWYPVGLGRLGIADNQSGYLAVIADNVSKRYKTKDKLDAAKATEWHRITLAMLACGGNPKKAGNDENIDLIADGVYNRTDGTNGILGRQGINGYIWGLIALDSLNYEVPSGAYYTRDDIISSILKCQLADGGFALIGTVSDPDITAMAVQSLAPYYNSEKEYNYTDKSGNPVTKKVRTVIDECIAWLSKEQQPDGDYFSWGMANVESTVQVAVALSTLGIDVTTDKRFIKIDADGKSNTLVDGILKYRTESGGFTHSFKNDADNPTAVAGEPNTMASEQTLYCMAALIRLQQGKRALYDFREEQSDALKAQISNVTGQIDALTEMSSKADVKAVYDAYWQITPSERRYVYNYYKLSRIMQFAEVPFNEEKMDYNSGGDEEAPTEYFDYDDQSAANALPSDDRLTTQYRAEVLRLLNKIKHSVDFEGKQALTIKLEKAKNKIDELLAEIDDIKAQIKAELYPFNSISLSKKQTVYALYNRYMALSEYDRTAFEASDVEGLLKCKTQVDNLQTALIITVCCVVAAAIVTVWIVLHIKKRRKLKREKLMPESDE